MWDTEIISPAWRVFSFSEKFKSCFVCGVGLDRKVMTVGQEMAVAIIGYSTARVKEAHLVCHGDFPTV